MEQRLQKILSNYGIASRRKAEQMILERRVRVNELIDGSDLNDPDNNFDEDLDAASDEAADDGHGE